MRISGLANRSMGRCLTVVVLAVAMVPVVASPAVATHGDSPDEMFFYRDDGLFRYYNVDSKGNVGKPILAGDSYTTGWSSITAVDLDGDGQDEMFFYRDDGLFRYYNVDSKGNVGKPILAGDSYTKGWSSITAVDLDDTPSDRGFHPFTVSGSGNDLISFRIPGDAPAILDITYNGASNFVVWSLDGSFDLIDLLVNEIGSYSGRRMVHGGWFFVPDRVRHLEIDSSGPWTITAQPLSAASTFRTSTSGTGDNILLYKGSAATITSTHDGSSNFVIWGYRSDGRINELIVNEIGSYSGTDLAGSGTSILDIQADGNWTLKAP
jgi:hypothetical protein